MRAGAVLLGLVLALPVAVHARPPFPPAGPAAVPVPLAPAVGQPAVAADPAPAPPTEQAISPAATSSAVMRTGNHPGFGRVVFDLPPEATWTLDRVGDRLTVRFSGFDPVAGAPPPHNVRALTAGEGVAELLLAPA